MADQVQLAYFDSVALCILLSNCRRARLLSDFYAHGCETYFIFFFFSSRRRHTRFDCDWSSDVCSSDLPVNLGLFSLGLRPDGRVFLLQPSPHGGRVLFVGAPHRLLWRQTPGPQIAPHRPERHVHAEPSGQQLLHRFPRPQRERQTQLVRAPAQNQPHGGGCLRRSQARAGRPSATPGLQPRTPFSLPKAHPAVDRSSRHPEQPRGLGLCKALANRLHHKPAQSLLRLGRKRTSILSFHVPNDGPDSGTCQLFYAPISNWVYATPIAPDGSGDAQGAARQQGNEFSIGKQEIVLFERSGFHPLDSFKGQIADGPGIVRGGNCGGKEDQLELISVFGVAVTRAVEFMANDGSHTELFGELPHQSRGSGCTVFHLAAGKLPSQRESVGAAALAN